MAIYNSAQSTSVILTCDITGSRYYWYKQEFSRIPLYSILDNSTKYGNANTSDLTIQNVDGSDNGNYLCRSDGDKNVVQSLSVYIVTSQGTKIQLFCPFVNTSYIWQRYTQNEWSTLTNNAKYANVNTNILTMFNIDGIDSGRFRCSTVNNEKIQNLYVIVNGGWSNWGEWTCTVTCEYGILVRYRLCNNPAPANGGSSCQGLTYDIGFTCYRGTCEAIPSIEIGQSVYNARIGGNITLECRIVNANPEVRNLWWTDSQLRKLNNRRYSGGTISKPSLTITEVITSDSGYYYCYANNTIGTSNTSTQLSTGNFPTVKIVFDRYISTTGINISVTIKYKVAYADNLTWFKDNAILQQNNKYDLDNTNLSYLVINNIEPEDRGVYKCQVTNNYGSQLDETRLNVVHTEVPNLSYENTVNESVTLNCVINDATDVKWRHNNAYILKDTDRYTGGNTTVPSLTITQLVRGDSGIYICESLYDSFTSTGNEIMLRIRDAPLVKSSTQFIQLSIGREAAIPCSYDSYPEPTTVIWTKDNKTLNSIDGIKYYGSTVKTPSLTIYNVNNSDTGIYVCYVKNQLGISSGKPVQLAVQVNIEMQTTTFCDTSATAEMKCTLGIIDALPDLWIHSSGGQVIRSLQGTLVNFTNILLIPFCNYQDMGDYMCTWRTNVQGLLFNKTTTLLVNGPPILLKQLISRDEHDTVLSVFFLSQPFPIEPMWYIHGASVLLGSDYQQTSTFSTVIVRQHKRDIIQHGFVSNLTIVNSKPNMYWDYTCKIVNDFGHLQLSFDVNKATPVPNSLNVNSPTDISTTIIVSTSVSGILILTIIFTVVVCKYRKRKKDNYMDPPIPSSSEPDVYYSIRLSSLEDTSNVYIDAY